MRKPIKYRKLVLAYVPHDDEEGEDEYFRVEEIENSMDLFPGERMDRRTALLYATDPEWSIVIVSGCRDD